MKKLLIAFLLFIYILPEALSQSSMPPAFEINSDSSTSVALTENYWQVMEDRQSNWSIERLNYPDGDNNFQTDYSGMNGIDYSVHTFWIRFSLKNKLNRSLSVALPNTNKASRSDFYILRPDSGWEHQVTGLLYPYRKRDGLKDMNLITFVIKPGETVRIYNRISNNYYVSKPKTLSAEFGITEKILENNFNSPNENYKNDLLYEVFQGIYFFGLVLNLLFFIIVRERIYLYYTIFLTYLFTESSVWPNFIFAANMSFYHYLEILITPVGIITYIQFLRYFLDTFKRTPKWDKALNIICVVLAVESVISFFIKPRISFSAYDSLYHFVDGLHCIGLLMILTTLISNRNRKDRPVKLLLLSGLPVVIWETIVNIPLRVWDFLAEHYGTQIPTWVQAIQKRYETINGLLMAWLALVFCWMLFQRFLNLQKQTAKQALEKERLEKEKEVALRELIEQQKINLEKTVEERTADLRQTLENLKSTQSQLIQSEKMASLGELTAGIAHEIQNPLNFVNNFSEVSRELVDELKSQKEKLKKEEQDEILNDLDANLEKINHHGKRADAIVKNMLQHSRKSTGQKELTDINALADEYIRLAYHGMRAKDKSFNVTIETDFDKTIDTINIIPQDIGRVILNLVNNAFYAAPLSATGGGFSDSDKNNDPTIWVSTKKIGDKILISVRDNGPGISQKIIDKIFQPFFTTKPTGQGTGLGLSLSYDIVKAHGGELKVNTKEGEGSEFIIQLPVV